MNPLSSKDVINKITADGWYEVRCNGSHHQFKHKTKKGTVTVKHLDKCIPKKTLSCIEKQARIKF